VINWAAAMAAHFVRARGTLGTLMDRLPFARGRATDRQPRAIRPQSFLHR
jgi:hypothetical protein